MALSRRSLPPMRGKVRMGGVDRKARTLRKRQTDAESALWQQVRLRQIEGCNLRRQHPIGPYIVDFVCLEK